jgi:RHS repeat-associated protein
VLSSVTYDPFGPITGWTWGNGTAMSRQFDTDGKLTQFDSAGLKTYAYDDAFRITGITDTVTAANSWTYGYDLLDRITSASKTGTTLGWTYDENGNRLTQTGSSASTFTISSTSNKVSSISGALSRSYSYDNSGNTTGYTEATATYNNHGRLKTLTKSAVTATYVYNALGQRIKQSGGMPGTVLYMYDEAGHLVGEYDAAGALIQETVWLGGTFKYNQRFAGQLYDSHAGLHQNHFRDYDPSTGRCSESDPIGLLGGLNTYGYVSGNPLLGFDPSGLDTCVLVTRGFLGFSDHAALYVSRGDESQSHTDGKPDTKGKPLIYDPSGSYARSIDPGNGDLITATMQILRNSKSFIKNLTEQKQNQSVRKRLRKRKKNM